MILFKDRFIDSDFKAIAIIFVLFSILTCWPVMVSADSLEIKQPWSLALPSVSKNGAAYFDIINHGEEDRLLGGSTEVADEVQIHTVENVDGQMKMQHLDSVIIPQHGNLHFQPGAMHIMLMGLKMPLAVGKTYHLTLEFEKAGQIEIDVPVQQTPSEMSVEDHSSHNNNSE